MKSFADRLCSQLQSISQDLEETSSSKLPNAERQGIIDATEISSEALKMVELIHELAMCLLALMAVQELVCDRIPPTDLALATRVLRAGDVVDPSPN